MSLYAKSGNRKNKAFTIFSFHEISISLSIQIKIKLSKATMITHKVLFTVIFHLGLVKHFFLNFMYKTGFFCLCVKFPASFKLFSSGYCNLILLIFNKHYLGQNIFIAFFHFSSEKTAF